MNQNFKFMPRDKVHILDINRPGVVTGCLLELDGRSYRVAYWNNGERKVEWILEEELRKEPI